MADGEKQFTSGKLRKWGGIVAGTIADFAGDPVALRPEEPRPQKAPQNDAGETVCGGGASKQKWAVYYCHKKVHVIESSPPNQ